MKGCLKKSFTPDEVKKVKDVYEHYLNFKDNFKEENYIREVLVQRWWGKITNEKEFDQDKFKKDTGVWFHFNGRLHPNHWNNLVDLVSLVRVSPEEVYLSEHLARTLYHVQEEEL